MITTHLVTSCLVNTSILAWGSTGTSQKDISTWPRLQEIAPGCSECNVQYFNLLPNDIILALHKLKASSDDKKNEMQITQNIMGKRGFAGYRYFSPLSTMFSKAFFLGVVKTREYMIQV